ncbi:glycosyltransferase family 2 protein [Kitasatospora sp. NPDC101447]|uniref:glycosyltransferase family 2 protein n=1 Tax=Kitasatospora sp. NPDC101447 TaxID=3364102 RepID=UPI00380F3A78
MNTPGLSVIVCAYTLDRWDDLCEAIGSLHAQRQPPEEILLVVDHCPALGRRAEAAFDGVRVLANRERQGLSGARNTGVGAARHEVVAFLDDDAAAEPDWTVRLLAPYRDPEVYGVGGLVVARWEDGSRPDWFPPEFDWVVGCSYRGLPVHRSAVRNFIGANMSFRRAEVLAVGGFRTDLGRVGTRPLGCEETEFCLRVAERHPGALLLHEPAAVVHHHVPPGRAGFSYFRSRCFAEGWSKAAVARHRGADAALSSERRYLRSTVPRAFGGCLRPGGGGPRRAGALAAGVALTVAGYALGRARAFVAPRAAREPSAEPSAESSAEPDGASVVPAASAASATSAASAARGRPGGVR